jgi:hypothetical protein
MQSCFTPEKFCDGFASVEGTLRTLFVFQSTFARKILQGLRPCHKVDGLKKVSL